MTRRVACIPVLLAMLLAGCDNTQPMTLHPQPQGPHVLLLHYPDFGPPDLAQELVGSYWYQWDRAGYRRGDYPYDIRVVVYKDIPAHDAQLGFPASAEEGIDFRLIEYRQAVAFLTAQRSRLESDPVAARTICPTLETTLARIHEKWPLAR